MLLYIVALSRLICAPTQRRDPALVMCLAVNMLLKGVVTSRDICASTQGRCPRAAMLLAMGTLLQCVVVSRPTCASTQAPEACDAVCCGVAAALSDKR